MLLGERMPPAGVVGKRANALRGLLEAAEAGAVGSRVADAFHHAAFRADQEQAVVSDFGALHGFKGQKVDGFGGEVGAGHSGGPDGAKRQGGQGAGFGAEEVVAGRLA